MEKLIHITKDQLMSPKRFYADLLNIGHKISSDGLHIENVKGPFRNDEDGGVLIVVKTRSMKEPGEPRVGS